MNPAAQFVVFQVDGRQYGVAVEQVECVVQAVDVTPLPKSPPLVLGVIDFHGELTPVFDIRRRVGSPPKPVGVDDHFVIVRSRKGGARLAALAADRVEGIQSIAADVTESPEAIWPGFHAIEGAARLATGLIILEEMDRFLSTAEDTMLEEALKEHAPHGG